MNIYIGEPVVVSDMKGPCPDGFHVPLSTEWQAVYDAGVSLGAWNSSNGVNFATYLKLPMAGLRNYDLSVGSVGTDGRYWSSSPVTGYTNRIHYLYFSSSGIEPQTFSSPKSGHSIRGLQNTPTIPTSSWTKLYGTSIESGGIFWNSTDGLISLSSDGSTWYTIMDKNLGATTVYNYGDTLTVANCGNVFQRGNNYGFPGTLSSDSITTSSTQVDITGYGPGNYYESSTWITISTDTIRRNSSNNGTNLRGGVSQGSGTKSVEAKNIYLGEGKTTVLSDMQGPCPAGFHVPLRSEWEGLQTIMSGLGLTTGNNWKINLHMPFAGDRYYSSAYIEQQNSSGSYWSSSPLDSSHPIMASYFYINSSNARFYGGSRGTGYSIRPFKNTYKTPDSTWIVITGTLGSAGIFWNQSEGLISITNGTTGYTIQDKNLGATTVYNNGDTLSEANCGKYYQWGNNYGFAWTGSVTTSSTHVDASSYGPGNYYDSSTFIADNDWASVPNDNLRGGVTQGSSTIVNPGIKEVYIGETKVYPKQQPRTFTISWTEKSNMSSGWTYSDDATGLTAGSTDFDDFFGYSAVKLASDGTESATVAQSSPGVLDITQLGTLTSGDNVMIKFPVRGIKMTKSGSNVTLSITEELGKESDGYQYYAFQKTGDIEANASTTVATKPLYMGAYLSYTNGSKLQSWSGQTPQGNYTMGNAITYAGANGTGWTITGWYQRQLINAYYMMKYGNPNSQSVIGAGYTGLSSVRSTGGTNSQTSATYGTSSTTTQVKLFGLEDWWGNQTQWVGGMFADDSKNMYVALHDFTANMSTSETQYKNAGTISNTGSYYCLSSILGTNKGMFGPTGTVNNSRYNTYYCDHARVIGARLARAGGTYEDDIAAGTFRVYVGYSAASAGAAVGSRLMYL